MFKKLDYGLFKQVLIPRIVKALEDTEEQKVRVGVLQCLHSIYDGIDQTTMKTVIFKAFEKVRSRENDP